MAIDFAAHTTLTRHPTGPAIARPRPGRLLSTMMVLSPLLAILAILALLGVLLWLVDTDERTAHREDLIRDALWVEQALQFQATTEEERLSRFATDLAKGDISVATFQAQATQLRQIAREISDLIWVGPDKSLIASVPPRTAVEFAATAPQLDTAFAIARSGRRGAFTAPFVRGDGKALVAFAAPIRSSADAAAGGLIAIFDLTTMLNEHVPWWIAERRAVHVADSVGNRLASRSRISPDDGSAAYSVQVGPPLHNVSLSVVSYRQRSNLAQNGLVGAMVALGLFASAGLIARERHLRRRREAELALDNEHAFRRALENSALVGMRARDLEGRLLYVNPAFCRMVGYEAHELIGLRPPMPYWAPEDMERTRRLHDKVLAGQASGQGLEFTFQHRDGTRFEVLMYEEPLTDADGNQRGWIGSLLDISDRKRMEEAERAQAAKLQHTARLVTMGEMASLLAHDLNQPLAAIQGYQTGLLNRLAGSGLAPGDLEPALKAIGQSADRAGRIVRRVHDFVKKSEPRLEPIDLADAVTETVALLEPETRNVHAVVEARLADDLPRVRADRVLIEQVLVNLLRNATEAVAGVPTERRRIRIEAHREDGRVLVRVSDTGPGVPNDLAQNLFSPFATLKPDGMGMGLTICRSIIEVHGGHIRHEPRAGGGAAFVFTLAQAGEA